MRWLDGITASMQVSLGELRELVIDLEACRAVIHGVTKSWTWLSDWTKLNWRAFRECGVFKAGATHLLAWPCSKPFSAANSDVLVVVWPHCASSADLHFGNTIAMFKKALLLIETVLTRLASKVGYLSPQTIILKVFTKHCGGELLRAQNWSEYNWAWSPE